MIKSVVINNFGPLENVQFDCKKFNIFQGKSHQGKTSILEAIKWAIIGGNDEFFVRNGNATCEVILVSDNNSRIERRLTRGGTSKLYIYGPDDKPLKQPQDVLNKSFNPYLFGPTDLVRMKAKDLNEFISNTISKRLKLDDVEIATYGLGKLDLSEDPVNAIQKYYDELFAERTNVNKVVKTFDTKTTGGEIVKEVTAEELTAMEVLVATTETELAKGKERNIKLDISKKQLDIKIKTENNIKILKQELENGQKILDDLNTSIANLEAIKKERTTLETELVNERKEVSNIQATLAKLESGEVICPINGVIKCTTDMKPYKEQLTKALDELKKNGIKKFKKTTDLKAQEEELQNNITTANNLKQKKIELDRAESIIGELTILDGEPIDLTKLETDLKVMKDELYKARLAKDISTVTGIDDARKRQDELNKMLEKLNHLLKEVIPSRLTLNVKNVTLGKEGLFFQGLPFHRLGDSYKLRLCTAILKDLFPNSNIFTLDKLETIDKGELEKYITHYTSENNRFQYFGSYVGDISNLRLPNFSIFNMVGFKMENKNGENG